MTETQACCYLSPIAFPHLLSPRDFLPVNQILKRKTLLEEVTFNIANLQRENAAIVIQGKPGSGRTSFAIFAATYCSSSTTCVHYFNQQSLNSKHFNLSIIESPAIPLCCLQSSQPSSVFTHIVILDDVVDLKHYLEVKTLVQKIDQSSRRKNTSTATISNTERKKKVLYMFIVDHPESRSLSTRMQTLLNYITLDSATESECSEIAHVHYSIPRGMSNLSSPFAYMGNLTTLFAAIRSFHVMQKSSKTSPIALLTDLPYCVTHRVAEHEKEVVFDIMKKVFQERKEIKFAKQQSLLQNTDIRNVSLHYLENLPIALDKQSFLPWKGKRTIYLQTLRVFTTGDYTEFKLFQHENASSASSLSTPTTFQASGSSSSSSYSSSYHSSFLSGSSYSLGSGTYSGINSSSSSSSSSYCGFGSSSSSACLQHHLVQKEMLQYLRLGMVTNLAIRILKNHSTLVDAASVLLPWNNARELEFTKMNTKYSMQQSEKWFLTLVSIKLGLFSIPKLLEACFVEHFQGLRAPLDSESSEIWKKYLENHSFFHDKLSMLSFNDFRHLFRFLHMHIGAMTTQSPRLQLSEDIWLQRTDGMLGKIVATKRKRKARDQ